MGAPWLRWQATLGADPKVVRAGFWGGVAYRATLEIVKAQGWGGVIPQGDLDGRILARHLNATPAEQERASLRLQEGFDACVRVGLLVPGPDGVLLIPRWPDFQPDPTVGSRVAAFRERQRLLREAAEGGARPETVTPVRNDDVTGRDGSSKRKEEGGGEGETVTPVPTPPSTAPAAAAATAPRGGGGALRLGDEQRATLEAAGISLRHRSGPAWKWEKAIVLLLRDGIPWTEVVDALHAAPSSLPPFLAFAVFEDRLKKQPAAAAAKRRDEKREAIERARREAELEERAAALADRSPERREQHYEYLRRLNGGERLEATMRARVEAILEKRRSEGGKP